MDEYSDIKARLSILRSVNMPPERTQEITNVLRREIQVYRNKKISFSRRKILSWLGSVSAAVIIATFFIVSMVQHVSIIQTKTASHKVDTVLIRYTPSQLSEIRSYSKNVGVIPWIPKYGLPGDTLMTVKNGGPGTLILVYKHFWLQEQTSPSTVDPRGKLTKKKVNIDGKAGVYMTVQVTVQNTTQVFSYLTFSKNGTYISMENLQGGPVPLDSSLVIASSFEQIR